MVEPRWLGRWASTGQFFQVGCVSKMFRNKKWGKRTGKQPVGIAREKEVAGGGGAKGKKRNCFSQHRGLSRAQLQKAQLTWRQAVTAKMEHM